MSGSRRDPSSMEHLQVLVLPSLYMVSRLLCLTRDKQLASLCAESPPQAVCVAPRAAAHGKAGRYAGWKRRSAVVSAHKQQVQGPHRNAAAAEFPSRAAGCRTAQQPAVVCVLHLIVQEGDRAGSLTAAFNQGAKTWTLKTRRHC